MSVLLDLREVGHSCLTNSHIETTMPKMKSNRAARKRFRVSASGHLKRKKAFHSHILTKKSPHRKRNLRKPGAVAVSDTPRVRRMIIEYSK